MFYIYQSHFFLKIRFKIIIYFLENKDIRNRLLKTYFERIAPELHHFLASDFSFTFYSRFC